MGEEHHLYPQLNHQVVRVAEEQALAHSAGEAQGEGGGGDALELINQYF